MESPFLKEPVKVKNQKQDFTMSRNVTSQG